MNLFVKDMLSNNLHIAWVWHHPPKQSKLWLQGGPLPVTNGVIIPYNPFQWPYKWVTGEKFSPYLHEIFHPIYNYPRGRPTLCHHLTVSSPTSRRPVLNAMLCRFSLMDLYGLEGTEVEGKWFSGCLFLHIYINIYALRAHSLGQAHQVSKCFEQAFLHFCCRKGGVVS